MSEIGSILSALTIVAVILYCFAWVLIGRSSECVKKGEGTWGFVWGAIFASLFYGFIVVGWYRYGLKKILFLMLACFLIIFTMAGLLCEDPDDRLGFAMLFALPVRALGGVFISRFDRRWRYSAIEKRRHARAKKKAAKALDTSDLEFRGNNVS